MANKKNPKGGRPPRVEGERLQRINLSLRPRVLFGLEVIARDRDISISQAVEYVFAVASRSYVVQETSLDELVSTVDALEDVQPAQGLFVDAHDGKKHTLEEQAEIASSFFRETGLARALQMPPALRTAEERYLIEVYETPGDIYWTEGESLRVLAAIGFRDGIAAVQTCESWRKLAQLNLSAKAPRPRPRKR